MIQVDAAEGVVLGEDELDAGQAMPLGEAHGLFEGAPIAGVVGASVVSVAEAHGRLVEPAARLGLALPPSHPLPFGPELFGDIVR